MRLDVACAVLATRNELLREPLTKIVRDAAIQRPGTTRAPGWKAAQACLAAREGGRSKAPKTWCRASLRAGVLSEDEARLAVEMADDHSLTSHIRKETAAQQIRAHPPACTGLVRLLLERCARHAS